MCLRTKHSLTTVHVQLYMHKNTCISIFTLQQCTNLRLFPQVGTFLHKSKETWMGSDVDMQCSA